MGETTLAYDALLLPFPIATKEVHTFVLDPRHKTIQKILDSSSQLIWERDAMKPRPDFFKHVETRKTARHGAPGNDSRARRP